MADDLLPPPDSPEAGEGPSDTDPGIEVSPFEPPRMERIELSQEPEPNTVWETEDG